MPSKAKTEDKVLLIVFLLLGAVSLIAPHYMFTHIAMQYPDVAAYGQWYGDAVIALAAAVAIYEIFLIKNASEVDVFLKICQMVDDDEFRKNYEYIRDDLLRDAVAADGIEALKDEPEYDRLEKAVYMVLYRLEKIGILVYHAVVNEKMVTDYVWSDVVNSFEALSQIIAFLQRSESNKTNKTKCERFVALYKTCTRFGWDVTPTSATSEPGR
jgi:hypothetical protein